MAFRLSRLRSAIAIVTKDGFPTSGFQQWWQTFCETIESQENRQDDLLTAIIAAQNAADTATAAAAAAQTAADNAQAAADDAAASADGGAAIASLTASGTVGCVITAHDTGSDVSISISAHTRVYGDGSSLAVAGGTVTGRGYLDLDYVYYSDPTRADTTPTYLASTLASDAAQVGDVHTVGSVSNPDMGDPDSLGIANPAPGL